MANFEAHFAGFHPLQSDEDASPEALMLARSRAALSWGRLQGLIAHLEPGVAHVLAASLIHAQLCEALLQAGHAGAASRFDLWFSGLAATPTEGPHVFARPWGIADAILAELSLASWEPIAQVAQQLHKVTGSDHGIVGPADALSPREVIALAGQLASEAGPHDENHWPLAAIDHLHALAAASADFAPTEPDRRLLDLPGGPKAFAQPRARPPLWAIDLAAGQVISTSTPGVIPLPCPGVLRAEALAPWLWPRERGILVADALTTCSQRLARLVEQARARHLHMICALADLRSNSRAPALYGLLAGFGPLRPGQIERALQVSKNGARELIKSLKSAGLADIEGHRGQVLIRASLAGGKASESVPGPDPSPALSAESLAEFDEAMADIDRLIARSNASPSNE
jgi:hypothetical protein